MAHHRVARFLIYTHRWLGIAGGALIFVWFASGIVMMYARMPALDPSERLARLPPVDFSSIRVAPASVAAEATRFTIATLDRRPVFRLVADGVTTVVFADNGNPLEPVDAGHAVRIAGAFAGGDQSTIRHDARLADSDQWTFGVRGQMPVHRIELGDRDGTHLYVSEQTGEVVMKTTATGRRRGYPGAVFHWIYFTPFRRMASLWSATIIWLSIAGVVLSVTGLMWGIWRYSPARRYRLKDQRRRSPYAALMRWHHYAGLLFGITTVTWIFSGLLSMDPWDWSPSTVPTAAQRAAVSRGPIRLDDVSLDRLRPALAAYQPAAPKEIDVVRFRGRYYLRAANGIVSLDSPARGPEAWLPADEMIGAARDAVPGARIDRVFWMDEYDAYYYDREGRLSLPVLRVRYDDPQETSLYMDPRRGTIARKEERLSRLNRWLYHGLHSLDFPFLYNRRPLWDIVVISLSVGGMLLSATTMAAAWRRVRRRLRASWPAA